MPSALVARALGNACMSDAFLPGQHPIEGYRVGGFHFAGMSHRGSILALPSGLRAWPVADVASLNIDAFAMVLAEPSGAIETLIVGAGETFALLPRAAHAVLNAAGIRVDVMATRHAIPTYNIMLGERRKVAGAFIAPTLSA